jgi:hypothetical protein
MWVLEELRGFRGIRFAKYQMSYRPETSFSPCFKKLFCARPAIEAKHQAVVLQDPICFRHRGLEPVCVGIVLQPAALPIVKVHQVRWISEYEVYALCRHLLHHVDTVAMNDRVEELFSCFADYVSGCHFFEIYFAPWLFPSPGAHRATRCKGPGSQGQTSLSVEAPAENFGGCNGNKFFSGFARNFPLEIQTRRARSEAKTCSAAESGPRQAVFACWDDGAPDKTRSSARAGERDKDENINGMATAPT